MATETLSSSRSCTCDICGVSESEDVIVPDLDLVGRVNAEVEWGQTLRFTKLNEKADFEASGQPMQTYKTGSKRRRKIKNEKPVILCDCHKHVVPVVEVKKIVDRRILNRKQHLNLLSQPRCLPTQNIEVVKVRKDTKCLPPRYVQMSVPLARRILDNWKDFQQVYSPEQMTNLKKLLQKQDALTTQEANKFFKILASRRRKEKRKQGGNLRAICHRSSKAKKDIDRVVNEVLKYFIKKPSSQVKDRHYVITNEIINRVIDKKIGKHLKRSNKDVYSMTLYQIIDQISVWIDQKVDEIDTVDLDDEGDGEEDEESSCTSGSDSDATDPDEIISNDELRALLEKTKKKDETESDEEYGPTSPESERGDSQISEDETEENEEEDQPPRRETFSSFVDKIIKEVGGKESGDTVAQADPKQKMINDITKNFLEEERRGEPGKEPIESAEIVPKPEDTVTQAVPKQKSTSDITKSFLEEERRGEPWKEPIESAEIVPKPEDTVAQEVPKQKSINDITKNFLEEERRGEPGKEPIESTEIVPKPEDTVTQEVPEQKSTNDITENFLEEERRGEPWKEPIETTKIVPKPKEPVAQTVPEQKSTNDITNNFLEEERRGEPWKEPIETTKIVPKPEDNVDQAVPKQKSTNDITKNFLEEEKRGEPWKEPKETTKIVPKPKEPVAVPKQKSTNDITNNFLKEERRGEPWKEPIESTKIVAEPDDTVAQTVPKQKTINNITKNFLEEERRGEPSKELIEITKAKPEETKISTITPVAPTKEPETVAVTETKLPEKSVESPDAIVTITIDSETDLPKRSEEPKSTVSVEDTPVKDLPKSSEEPKSTISIEDTPVKDLPKSSEEPKSTISIEDTPVKDLPKSSEEPKSTISIKDTPVKDLPKSSEEPKSTISIEDTPVKDLPKSSEEPKSTISVEDTPVKDLSESSEEPKSPVSVEDTPLKDIEKSEQPEMSETVVDVPKKDISKEILPKPKPIDTTHKDSVIDLPKSTEKLKQPEASRGTHETEKPTQPGESKESIIEKKEPEKLDDKKSGTKVTQITTKEKEKTEQPDKPKEPSKAEIRVSIERPPKSSKEIFPSKSREPIFPSPTTSLKSKEPKDQDLGKRKPSKQRDSKDQTSGAKRPSKPRDSRNLGNGRLPSKTQESGEKRPPKPSGSKDDKDKPPKEKPKKEKASKEAKKESSIWELVVCQKCEAIRKELEILEKLRKDKGEKSIKVKVSTWTSTREDKLFKQLTDHEHKLSDFQNVKPLKSTDVSVQVKQDDIVSSQEKDQKIPKKSKEELIAITVPEEIKEEREDYLEYVTEKYTYSSRGSLIKKDSKGRKQKELAASKTSIPEKEVKASKAKISLKESFETVKSKPSDLHNIVRATNLFLMAETRGEPWNEAQIPHVSESLKTESKKELIGDLKKITDDINNFLSSEKHGETLDESDLPKELKEKRDSKSQTPKEPKSKKIMEETKRFIDYERFEEPWTPEIKTESEEKEKKKEENSEEEPLENVPSLTKKNGSLIGNFLGKKSKDTVEETMKEWQAADKEKSSEPKVEEEKKPRESKIEKDIIAQEHLELIPEDTKERELLKQQIYKYEREKEEAYNLIKELRKEKEGRENFTQVDSFDFISRTTIDETETQTSGVEIIEPLPIVTEKVKQKTPTVKSSKKSKELVSELQKTLLPEAEYKTSKVSSQPRISIIEPPKIETARKSIEITPALTADLKTPEVKAPEVKVDLKASDMKVSDAKSSELVAELEKTLLPESSKMSNIKAPEVKADLKTPDLKSVSDRSVDLKAPDFEASNVKTDLKDTGIKTPELSSEFKIPDMKAPDVEAEFKAPDVKGPELTTDLEVPDIKIPEVKADIKAPDFEAPKVQTDLKDTGIKTPEFSSEFKIPDIKAPDVEAEFKAPVVKGPELTTDLEVPEIKIPEAKADLKAPDIEAPKIKSDLKDTGIKTPEFSSEFKIPDIKAPDVEAEFKAPNVKGPELSTDPEAPELKIPETKADLKAPDIEAPKIKSDLKDTGIKTPEFSLEFKIPEIKAPDVQAEFKSPDVKGPELSTDLKAPEIKIPEAKADLKAPDIETPDLNADIKVPDIKDTDLNKDFKAPDVEALNAPDLKTPDIKTHLEVPEIEADPKVPDIKAPEVKADLEDPDVKANLKTPDIKVPDIKTDLKAPDMSTPDLKTDATDVKADLKTSDIEAPDVKTDLKVQDIMAPDMSADVKTSDIKSPDVNADLKDPEIKTPAVETDFKAPEIKGPNAKADLKSPDIASPKIKSPNISFPKVETGEASEVEEAKAIADWVEPHIKSPDSIIEVNTVDLPKDKEDLNISEHELLAPKPDDESTKIVEADLKADVKPPEIKVPEVESGSKTSEINTPIIESDAVLKKPEVETTTIKSDVQPTSNDYPTTKVEIPDDKPDLTKTQVLIPEKTIPSVGKRSPPSITKSGDVFISKPSEELFLDVSPVGIVEIYREKKEIRPSAVSTSSGILRELTGRLDEIEKYPEKNKIRSSAASTSSGILRELTGKLDEIEKEIPPEIKTTIQTRLFLESERRGEPKIEVLPGPSPIRIPHIAYSDYSAPLGISEDYIKVNGVETGERGSKIGTASEREASFSSKDFERSRRSSSSSSEEGDKEPRVHKMMVHCPHLVCCKTLKLWSEWLIEVAQNTQKWSDWIHTVISQIKFYSLILKGKIKNPDGTTRVLYREEWDLFKQQLNNDVEEFLKYHSKVKELSENMMNRFMGKDVACCPTCLKEKLIKRVDKTHSVISTLGEALRTSEHWRNFLTSLVEQTKKIVELPLENLQPIPEGSTIESVSVTPQSSIFDLLDTVKRPTICVRNLQQLEKLCLCRPMQRLITPSQRPSSLPSPVESRPPRPPIKISPNQPPKQPCVVPRIPCPGLSRPPCPGQSKKQEQLSQSNYRYQTKPADKAKTCIETCRFCNCWQISQNKQQFRQNRSANEPSSSTRYPSTTGHLNPTRPSPIDDRPYQFRQFVSNLNQQENVPQSSQARQSTSTPWEQPWQTILDNVPINPPIRQTQNNQCTCGNRSTLARQPKRSTEETKAKKRKKSKHA